MAAVGKASERASKHWEACQIRRLAALAAAESMQIGDFADLEIGPTSPHTEPMHEITRYELDSKMDATNAKVDSRLAAFESTVRETMAAVRQDSAEMRGELKAIHVDLEQLKNIKANIWGAAGAVLLAFLAAAISIYFGIASNNQMLVSNAIAGFGAGKDVSAAQAEIKQLNREALEILQQIRAQQATAPPLPAPQQ